MALRAELATGELDRLRSEVESEYRELTPSSLEFHERAAAVLPGGDTRQGLYFRPHPLYLDAGAGSQVRDLDGNGYLDCSNCMSALVLGHAHPAVVGAVSSQAALGSAFSAYNRFAVELAELITERMPSIERIRFANSGTEATMLAVRAARGFTGRPKLVKMVGGYHGSHDEFMAGAADSSEPFMPGARDNVLEVPFNDIEALGSVMAQHGHEVAAVIMEPVLSNGGAVAPADGYLHAVRQLTASYGVLLIFDEVVTFRLALGGAQELYGVRPDLTALGKAIGGGYPVGAFGGRADIMAQFSPETKAGIAHHGTFNGNPVSMVAGIATLRELDARALGHLNTLGAEFAIGVEQIALKVGIPMQVSGVGSLRNVHFGAIAPTNAEQAAGANKQLLPILHLKLLIEGFLAAERGSFSFSSVTTNDELRALLTAFEIALSWLEPAVA